MAIPFAAVSHIDRLIFDITDDERLSAPELQPLLKNMFEVFLKEEFLPIYTHP